MVLPPHSAYIHVPFCRHRCGYCDFSLVAGRDDLIDRYFQALARELSRVGQRLMLDTLYFGGGTPSHLGPDGIRQLFAILADAIVTNAGAEVSLEANPLDVTIDFVAAARDCGVNRVSRCGHARIAGSGSCAGRRAEGRGPIVIGSVYRQR